MVYRTFGDLKSQVEQEVDTEGEEFIQEQEMMNYFNSAVILCEATIVKLGLKEKYLQAEAFVSPVPGQSDYDLPADIVINKIRKITYSSQTTAYTVKPFITERAYAYEDQIRGQNTASELYDYTLYKIGNVQKIRLIPCPQIAVPNALRVIYFKSLQRYTADTDFCDLPDVCYEYLMSYVRYRIYAKESHVNTPDEKLNMSALLTLMQETMQGQVADPDIEINDLDLSHYMEMN
jgi:hypothetical protein